MSNTVKHENPYRAGSSYHTAFAIAQKKQVISLPEWIKLTAEATGKDLEHAAYDVNVVKSPSKDKWGSKSADGANAYFESCIRKVVDGVKEPIKEKLRWREESMANPYAKTEKAPKAIKTVKVKAEKTKVAKVKKPVKKAKDFAAKVVKADVIAPAAPVVAEVVATVAVTPEVVA